MHEWENICEGLHVHVCEYAFCCVRGSTWLPLTSVLLKSCLPCLKKAKPDSLRHIQCCLKDTWEMRWITLPTASTTKDITCTHHTQFILLIKNPQMPNYRQLGDECSNKILFSHIMREVRRSDHGSRCVNNWLEWAHS